LFFLISWFCLALKALYQKHRKNEQQSGHFNTRTRTFQHENVRANNHANGKEKKLATNTTNTPTHISGRENFKNYSSIDLVFISFQSFLKKGKDNQKRKMEFKNA